jgi:hypothetical protein
MRRYVGGERRFDSFLQNGARVPGSACAPPRGVPCRALVRTSYVAPRRRVVIGPGKRRPTSRHAVGGRLRGRGLAKLSWCDPDRGFAAGAPEPPGPAVRRCPGPQTVITEEEEFVRLVNRSWTRQLVVAWNHAARLVAELPPAGHALAQFEPGAEVLPAPGVHADLAPAAALAVPD